MLVTGIWKSFVPFLVTIVLAWWLRALLVPILGCLYLLNKFVVRVGKLFALKPVLT